ncbi:MAG TPA: TIM-barrel domain-containing protein, partial [Chloroflexota bacterium]|nr:TIM-barrel domain-containing protein [Chloroflexota bacterium]
MRAEDQGAPAIPRAVRPPLTPRWVFEPWAWEDNSNTAAAVDDLVDGYLSNGIPLGAVMIDSPWATNYNTFEFGPDYPNPGMFISRLKERGIRVVLWATPVVNLSSLDG